MIVKIAPNRRDGMSSFKALGDYITEGIEQSGDHADRTNWDDLTQYITHQCVLDALGDGVEKTIGVEIGNISSLANAPAAMAAVAARTTEKKTNPVLHLILSWPEHEKPDPKSIFRATRHVIGSMGLLEHQYIIAIHDNTENRHAHIEINRIHPRTFRPARLEWLRKTVHKAAREAEIEQGWSHDNGIFEVIEVNGRKVIVEALERERLERASSFGANRAETWSGEVSLEAWCKDGPAEALRQTLDRPGTTSWQHIHDTLAGFGLELRDSGGGGMRVHDISLAEIPEDGEGKSVSASRAFRFMKRAALEARFGAFQPSQPSPSVAATADVGFKRDPLKRLERKLERREIRDALHARFKTVEKAAREEFKALEAALRTEFAGSDAARRAVHKATYMEARQAIARDPRLDKELKQMAYMIAKLSHARAGIQLRDQLSAERAHRRAALPEVPVWRTWVEGEAAAGDEAAISALRGMVYQDGRDAKKGPAAIAAEEATSDVGIIRPARRTNTDPYARILANLTHTISKHGTVAYSLDPGKTAFLDVGPKLRFGGTVVGDDELKAALLYAADKWRGTLRLNGGDRVFRERAARVAADMNIQILNPDLRAVQRQHLAAHRAPASLSYQHPTPLDQQRALLARKYQSLPTHREAYEHDFKNPYERRQDAIGTSSFGDAHPAAIQAHAHALAGRSPAETLNSLRNLSNGPLAGVAGRAELSDALRRDDRRDGTAGAGRLANAQPATPRGAYVGSIVGRDERFLYQQAATGLVRHEITPALAALGIEVGKSVKVQYRSGRPSIPQTRSRS